MTLRDYDSVRHYGPAPRVLTPEEISRHDARAAAREAGLLLGLAYRYADLADDHEAIDRPLAAAGCRRLSHELRLDAQRWDEGCRLASAREVLEAARGLGLLDHADEGPLFV